MHVMQGELELSALVHWLRFTAASQPAHASHQAQSMSRRKRRAGKRMQQPVDQPADADMRPANLLHNSTHTAAQHSSQQLPAEQQLLFHQDTNATTCSEHQNTAAVTGQETPVGMADALSLHLGGTAAHDADGADRLQHGRTACVSSQQEDAYMDCLSQLRDAMYADLPAPVSAEPPPLDHAAGEQLTQRQSLEIYRIRKSTRNNYNYESIIFYLLNTQACEMVLGDALHASGA